MEMENLRRECEQREGEERERHVGEVREWAERVAVLEEKCRVMAGEVEEGRRAKADCDQARERSAVHVHVHVLYTHALCSHTYMYMYMHVHLFDLACFFLPPFSSLIKTCTEYTCTMYLLQMRSNKMYIHVHMIVY